MAIEIVRNMCPHCGTRLDLSDSITAPIRARATYRINRFGQLERMLVVVVKQGTYKCNECGYRLSQFIKEAKVGIIGGSEDAATNTAPNIHTERG